MGTSQASYLAGSVRLVRMNLQRRIPDFGQDRQPTRAFDPSATPPLDTITGCDDLNIN